MEYPRNNWYSSQDETFVLGCCMVIPTTCLLLYVISQMLLLQHALLLGLLLAAGASAILYIHNRQRQDSVQKVFRTKAYTMNEIVESILIDKQLPYDKFSKDRNVVYWLSDNDIEITVGPYIYTVYRSKGRSKRVEDGIVIKIRAPKLAQDLLLKSIKNKIDEEVIPLNLT